uniref:sucrose synthase n=1 Tax=Aegilops tauschii subsp. strangulata TaxID=200361 RepID=A0A453TD05_AEGTS
RKTQATGTRCPLLDFSASTNGYTWKIYATKVLNMGSMYGFWRTLNKEERAAKQRYLQMFYNLQYRNLVKTVPRIGEQPPRTTASTSTAGAAVVRDEIIVRPK